MHWHCSAWQCYCCLQIGERVWIWQSEYCCIFSSTWHPSCRLGQSGRLTIRLFTVSSSIKQDSPSSLHRSFRSPSDSEMVVRRFKHMGNQIWWGYYQRILWSEQDYHWSKMPDNKEGWLTWDLHCLHCGPSLIITSSAYIMFGKRDNESMQGKLKNGVVLCLQVADLIKNDRLNRLNAVVAEVVEERAQRFKDTNLEVGICFQPSIAFAWVHVLANSTTMQCVWDKHCSSSAPQRCVSEPLQGRILGRKSHGRTRQAMSKKRSWAHDLVSAAGSGWGHQPQKCCRSYGQDITQQAVLLPWGWNCIEGEASHGACERGSGLQPVWHDARTATIKCSAMVSNQERADPRLRQIRSPKISYNWETCTIGVAVARVVQQIWPHLFLYIYNFLEAVGGTLQR